MTTTRSKRSSSDCKKISEYDIPTQADQRWLLARRSRQLHPRADGKYDWKSFSGWPDASRAQACTSNVKAAVEGDETLQLQAMGTRERSKLCLAFEDTA